MRIIIDFIDHSDQRYDTAGDWQWLGDNLLISISDTGKENMNFLLAAHELIEAMLCRANDIATDEVDEFDFTFRGTGDEPGDDPDCPYWYEHFAAETLERLLAQDLQVNWLDYQWAIDKLGRRPHGNETADARRPGAHPEYERSTEEAG